MSATAAQLAPVAEPMMPGYSASAPVTYVTSQPAVAYAAAPAVAYAPTAAVVEPAPVMYATSEAMPVSGVVGGSVAAPQVVSQVVSQPARFTVSPEIFAKLASGGALTPEEMAQLTGQAPPPVVALETAVPVAVEPAAPA